MVVPLLSLHISDNNFRRVDGLNWKKKKKEKKKKKTKEKRRETPWGTTWEALGEPGNPKSAIVILVKFSF